MSSLLQALAWLELSATEHTRENKGQVRIAVDMALQLRESLSDTDVKEQLDLAVKHLPSDIELYWAPFTCKLIPNLVAMDWKRLRPWILPTPPIIQAPAHGLQPSLHM
ncbi:MAG: hypothetical protein U0930_17015 [Pirellulales bacterium]